VYATELTHGAEESLFKPVSWTGPPWLFEETGYALKAGKLLMLFQEDHVEMPGLHGDLEYIPYTPSNTAGALLKALEMFARLIANRSGIETVISVSGFRDQPPEDTSMTEKELAVGATDQSGLGHCIDDLIQAKVEKDLDHLDRARESGLLVIRSGDGGTVDEISWLSLCVAISAELGDQEALERLRLLGEQNPDNALPYRHIAFNFSRFGEYKAAGDWFARTADLNLVDQVDDRLRAAEAYQKAKLPHVAKAQLDIAQRSDPGETLRTAVLKQLFSVYKADDALGSFCFAEAALLLQPNDYGFRFDLAYAYAEQTGGSSQHDYRDLALFHYRLLVKADSSEPFAENDLGVVYRDLGAPILPVEGFKTSSETNALAVSNLMRQYIKAGFVDEARRCDVPPKSAPLISGVFQLILRLQP